MMRVWSDALSAGLLDRHGANGAVFAYAADAASARAVSLTMPVRLASWDQAFGIHPIFEMNLPEGYLREKLRLAFAKATGTFDNRDKGAGDLTLAVKVCNKTHALRVDRQSYKAI